MKSFLNTFGLCPVVSVVGRVETPIMSGTAYTRQGQTIGGAFHYAGGVIQWLITTLLYIGIV